jgi:hypothetical protein
LLKGGECDLLKVDREKLMAGDEGEKEKIYRLIPEFDLIRKQGNYDVVGKLVELAGRLQSERVADLAAAVSVMISVMFGAQISEEDAKKVGAVVDALSCVRFDEDGVFVDNECLDAVDVPEQFKDELRMVTMLNLVKDVI